VFSSGESSSRLSRSRFATQARAFGSRCSAAVSISSMLMAESYATPVVSVIPHRRPNDRAHPRPLTAPDAVAVGCSPVLASPSIFEPTAQ
jgi:hypothetical protein